MLFHTNHIDVIRNQPHSRYSKLTTSISFHPNSLHVLSQSQGFSPYQPKPSSPPKPASPPTELTVGQPSPARDEANHAREILVPLRHADGDNMLVEGHGSLHLEQSQVVVEGLSHVASVDDHSFHVALDGFLGLVVVREVELAQDDDERGEEPVGKWRVEEDVVRGVTEVSNTEMTLLICIG